MSKLRVLNFQYNLSKKLSRAPVKWLSIKDRQYSDSLLRFVPDVEEMKQVFYKMSGKNDKIDLQDLKLLLAKLNKGGDDSACEADAKQLMQAVDLNNDGLIDFQEFMEVHKRGVRISEIKSAFWMFDTNGDGRISAEEVRDMMKKLGEDCSLEQCRRMVKSVDGNSDGLVDMDDFMAMMTATMKLN